MRSALLLAAALACVAAAPAPRCPKPGQVPALNGDPFAPVECSTAPAAAVPLPPAALAEPAAPDWKELEGRWEGVLIRGFGRFASTLEIRRRRKGAVEATLRWKEQQLRQTGESKLALSPSREPGAYRAVLTASALPGASLEGRATFSREKEGGRARLELSFPNGAAHRLVWSVGDKSRLPFTATWAVPSAPLQTLEGALDRTGR